MKKWMFLASMLLGTAIYAQTDSTSTVALKVDNSALKAEIKKELVGEITTVVNSMKDSQKKESEDLKFKIKALEGKLAKEIKISEKQKTVDESKKESILKIKGLTFLRSRNEFTKTDNGTYVAKTSNHYMLGIARVDFEKQVTPEVKANLRIATDGPANLFVLRGTTTTDENGNVTETLPTRPSMVVDHAYMTLDAGLTTNKVGMIFQKSSAAKDNYFAVSSKGDGAYIDAGDEYYSLNLRNTLIGLRSEISFDENFGLNLTISKFADNGINETVNDSITKEKKDLYTLIAEFPMSLSGMKFIPEGLIGISDSITNITAGMDIIIPTSFAQFVVSGAGNFRQGSTTKNGLLTFSAKIPVIKTKDVAFSPIFSYRVSGETQDNFSSESLLVQHYLDFKFKTTYKRFSIRPRYRAYIRPNASVTALGGGSNYSKQRFECDFMVSF